MSVTKLGFVRFRVVALAALCVVSLVWNIALSTRRKYSSGKLVRVKQEDVILKVSCPGKIEPKVQETVHAQLDGAKKEVLVSEGDSVKEGQLLMEISDAQIRTEVSKKKTVLQNARTDYAKARKDYELSKRLYKQLAVPRQDVDNARETFERAGQTLSSAQDDLAVSIKKQASAKVNAPFDGIILKIFIGNDHWINTDKELVKVAKMDKFIIRGSVDELDIARVAVGQHVTIACDAYRDRQMDGQVASIGAEAGEGAFPEVEVVVDIGDTKGINLKPNLSCSASIITGQLPHAVVLPVQSIRHSRGGAYVLRSGFGGWLVEQPVVVSKNTGGQAVIEKGVQPNQMVLVPKEE